MENYDFFLQVNGSTPIMVACKEGKYALVEKLLERGASLSDIDVVGYFKTLMHVYYLDILKAFIILTFLNLGPTRMEHDDSRGIFLTV